MRKVNERSRKQEDRHVPVEPNVLSFQPGHKALKLVPVHLEALCPQSLRRVYQANELANNTPRETQEVEIHYFTSCIVPSIGHIDIG